MTLTAINSLESAEKKIFHELDVHDAYQKLGIKRFMGSGGQNEL